MFLDFLVVLIAYIAAFWVRSAVYNARDVAPVLLMALVSVTILYVAGVYRRIWSQTSGYEAQVLLIATSITTAFALVYGVLTRWSLPLSIILIANLLSISGFVAVRYRSRLLSGLVWRWNLLLRHQFPKEFKRVLIIGAGESGQALARRMNQHLTDKSYRVIGFIDDDPQKQDLYIEGCRVLGAHTDIDEVVKAYHVDLIVVAIHNISGEDFRDILMHCERTQAMIKVVPDLFASLNDRTSAGLLRDVEPEDLIGRTPVTRYEKVDLTPMMRRVILVTGAAGSIGSELSRQVMTYVPAKVVLIDNNESGLHDLVIELQACYPNLDIVPVLGDITVPQVMRAVFDKHHPELVFHAAAYKHVPMLEYYPVEALRVNVEGTRTLAELALEYGVERFVLISTDKAVNPSSVMGASKRVCELMLHALAQREDCRTLFAAVRFGNVLGSRGSVVPLFTQQIESGGPVKVTHPEMTRYFMSIPEAVNLIIHAACMTRGDDIYILKMGEVVRIVELAERMIRLRGLRPYTDIPIEFTGVRPGEKMHEELFSGAENPTETIHPGIVQLNTWDEHFDVKRFWNEVGRLLEDMINDDVAALRKIERVIAPQREVFSPIS
jgi:FlaA1/EpsC-like NDP-sugar epimerase